MASAATIGLGVDGVAGQKGNAGGWTVTSAGAVNATPYNIAATSLGLSSDGYNSGTPVSGATPGAFVGFAAFTTSFNLPSGATGATLHYADLAADDRFVFELNGQVLRTSGIFAPTTPTAGTFVFAPGGAETPVNYQSDVGGSAGSVSGYDTAFFNVGGQNTLTLLVNATYNGYHDAGTPDGLIHGDFKYTGFSASSIDVTFNSPTAGVPEPATWAMMIVGLGGLGAQLRRGRRLAPAPA